MPKTPYFWGRTYRIIIWHRENQLADLKKLECSKNPPESHEIPVASKWDSHLIWLVVSTHLKNISQIGSFPQVGVKIQNIWNHHPVMDILYIIPPYPEPIHASALLPRFVERLVHPKITPALKRKIIWTKASCLGSMLVFGGVLGGSSQLVSGW